MKQGVYTRVKRAALLFSVLLLISACAAEPYPPKWNIVYEVGYTPAPDKRSFAETVTELSTQIIVCTLREREVQRWDAANGFHSLYTAEIREILMDVRGTLSVGDNIRFSSTEGLIPAAEAAAVIEAMQASASSDRLRELAETLRDAPDGSYALSSSYDGIPLVAGSTYLVYLSDWGMDPYREEMGSDSAFMEEADDYFSESGLSHMYELRRGKIYRGKDTGLQEITEKQLKEQIREEISRRTGIAHEIGVFPYIQQYVRNTAETP